MISEAAFFGGVHAQTLTVGIQPLHPYWARFFIFRTSGTHGVELVDPSDALSMCDDGGGVFFYVLNASNVTGSNIVEVDDHLGNLLVSLVENECAEINLENDSGALSWHVKTRTRRN